MGWNTCEKSLKYSYGDFFFFRICGHRNLNTKIDSRPFGFPFDRNIDFDFNSKHKYIYKITKLKFLNMFSFLGDAVVNIIFNKDNENMEDLLAKVQKITTESVEPTSLETATDPTLTEESTTFSTSVAVSATRGKFLAHIL